jgi:hypothetical protein
MNFITQEQSTIMPPAPPADPSVEQAFIPGEFEYADQWDRGYLKDAYQVISRNEWWGPFKQALLSHGVNDHTGFQFSNDPLYNKIMTAISRTYIGGGHSGCSIGATMRVMQTIALKGETEYRRQCIQYQIESRKNKEAIRIQRQLAEVRRQMDEEDRRIMMLAEQERPTQQYDVGRSAHIGNFENSDILPKEEHVEESAL